MIVIVQKKQKILPEDGKDTHNGGGPKKRCSDHWSWCSDDAVVTIPLRRMWGLVPVDVLTPNLVYE